MAVTIVATAGASTANAFITLAEAETYMEARLNASTWDDASDDSKNRAIVEATRELSHKTYCGERVTSTQALSWPRQNAPDPDSPFADHYSTTVVPQRVKDATAELAFQFIKAGTSDVAAVAPLAGVKRKKVDVLETEYDTYQTRVGLDRYPSVTRYIKPLLSGSTGITVPVVMG